MLFRDQSRRLTAGRWGLHCGNVDGDYITLHWGWGDGDLHWWEKNWGDLHQLVKNHLD